MLLRFCLCSRLPFKRLSLDPQKICTESSGLPVDVVSSHIECFQDRLLCCRHGIIQVVFRSQHQDELNRYDEAVRYFKENNAGKIPAMNELREKKKALATEQDRQKKEAEKIRKGLKNLQTAVSNAEVILDTKSVPERRNQELQVQKKKSYRGQELS